MKKTKSTNVPVNTQQNFDELLLEDFNKADDIPIEWLPKDEPITKTMSYKKTD